MTAVISGGASDEGEAYGVPSSPAGRLGGRANRAEEPAAQHLLSSEFGIRVEN